MHRCDGRPTRLVKEGVEFRAEQTVVRTAACTAAVSVATGLDEWAVVSVRSKHRTAQRRTQAEHTYLMCVGDFVCIF